MQKKIRPAFLIILLAVILLAVFHFSSRALEMGLEAFVNHRSPALMILVGEPSLCEQAKSKISSQSLSEKEQSYKELLSMMKWPKSEFRSQVEKQSFIREILVHLRGEDIPSGAGIYMAEKCYLETMGTFTTHFAETLPALFQSEFLHAPKEGPVRTSLYLLTQGCYNQTGCADPVKKEIIRLGDYERAKEVLNILPQMGLPAIDVALEVFDTLDDKQLSTENSNAQIMGQALLGHLQSGGLSTQQYSRQKLELRFNDNKYSQSKKDFITKHSYIAQNLASKFIEKPVAPPLSLRELISKGQSILNDAKKELPSSTRTMEEWLYKVQVQQSSGVEASDKKSLSQLLADYLRWAIENLGPEANLIQTILQTSSDATKVQQPLPGFEAFLKSEKTQLIGIRLLMTESPLSDSSLELLRNTLKKVNEEKRRKAVFMIVSQKAPTGRMAFEIGELLTDTEFEQNHYYFQYVKDDYVLNLKKRELTTKDPAAKTHLLWRGYMISSDDSFAKRIIADWSKNVACTEERSFQIRSFISSHRDFKSELPMLDAYLKCYAKKDQQEFVEDLVYNLLERAEVRQNEAVFTWLKKTKNLSATQKESLLTVLKQKQAEYEAHPPMEETGD